MVDFITHLVNQLILNDCLRNQYPLRKLSKWLERLFRKRLQNGTVNWVRTPDLSLLFRYFRRTGKLCFLKYRIMVECLAIPSHRTMFTSGWISTVPRCLIAPSSPIDSRCVLVCIVRWQRKGEVCLKMPFISTSTRWRRPKLVLRGVKRVVLLCTVIYSSGHSQSFEMLRGNWILGISEREALWRHSWINW
jgi:hypothetical protein